MDRTFSSSHLGILILKVIMAYESGQWVYDGCLVWSKKLDQKLELGPAENLRYKLFWRKLS